MTNDFNCLLVNCLWNLIEFDGRLRKPFNCSRYCAVWSSTNASKYVDSDKMNLYTFAIIIHHQKNSPEKSSAVKITVVRLNDREEWGLLAAQIDTCWDEARAKIHSRTKQKQVKRLLNKLYWHRVQQMFWYSLFQCFHIKNEAVSWASELKRSERQDTTLLMEKKYVILNVDWLLQNQLSSGCWIHSYSYCCCCYHHRWTI